MKLKQLILVLFVAFQTIISSAAFAWSPLNGVEAAVERMQHCYFTAASSEGEERGKTQEEGNSQEGEEEEEPDCD